LKSYDFYIVLMTETIPKAAKQLLPEKCCEPWKKDSTSGSLSNVGTGPLQAVGGGEIGVEPSYSFDLNNTIGTINSLRWTVTCTVGSATRKDGKCCNAYAKGCVVEFELKDRYTFNTGGKDALFQWIFGDFMDGEEYDFHNTWTDDTLSSQMERICPP